MTRKSTRYFITATVLFATVAIIVYASFDPQYHHFPKCPFLVATGWKCAGCGSQRALHALFNGNFADAWNFNPAIFVGIPIAAIYALADLSHSPALRKAVLSLPAIATLILLIFGWWVGRNIFNL